jgi:hypothetical protein
MLSEAVRPRLPVLLWFVVLVALMLLDVLLSLGVLRGSTAYLSEGNPFAKGISPASLGMAKLGMATIALVYALNSHRASVLKVCTIGMVVLTVWNVGMLVLEKAV